MEPPDERDLEATEVSPVRAKKGQIEPSKVDRDDHELLHEPYRDWCRACVVGRGRSDAHVTRTNAEKQYPVVGFDYGCLKEILQGMVEGDDSDEDLTSGNNSPC